MSAFNRSFANWDICLPKSAVKARERGRIVERGWTIWYVCGSDDGGEYLDYYASHRMTNDRHVRLHADGRSESLETVQDSYVLPKDPAKAEQAKAKFRARNRAVRRMLDEKGFTLDEGVHPSAAVRHYQLTLDDQSTNDEDHPGANGSEVQNGT